MIGKGGFSRVFLASFKKNQLQFAVKIISKDQLLQQVKGFDIHSINIIHRDLKPENILLYDQNDQTNIKIADFGLATYDNSVQQSMLYKKCGTPGFIAPEILQDNIDIFSAGVIFYILLTGEQPFKAANNKQLVEKNKACQIDFSILNQNNTVPKEASIY
ncbi:hypothetical protein IMG5_129000 [Ichthyophthirius multifiliis]|uniref:Protein kinase domain-containing protein n=1 Tax=Ichthyophthirius multifiliis TaxID=5932 RepID=G0QW30_ICHMU|nr:hypothetical protein IMG5_129000 [Ichthyophthirius multifiliis]EGR30567.1 hypothetical protein IMG5_129000 [Ichthyophthirius multifiliis]|eukprot:XP_004032154.1 hypothetical protein IMG5_129000 [Ichthyophthirius multifiliis]